jgi:hypothetical protein
LVALSSIRYTKADLAAVPEDERAAHFLLAHIANDLSMLQRQMILNLRHVEGDHLIEKIGRTGYGMLLTQILAGRLYEAWNVLRSPMHAKLFRDYEQLIEKTSLDALINLKRYFNTNNIVQRVRNEVAFHFDIEAMKESYATVRDTDPFTDYIAERVGNSFYESAAYLSRTTMARIGGGTNIQEGVSRVVGEVGKVAGWMMLYINGFTVAFVRKNLKTQWKNMHKGKVEVRAPRLKDSHALFFYEADESDLLAMTGRKGK